MQAQNDLAVSSWQWHCGGHNSLQGLGSERSRYFAQHSLSQKSSSSFRACCGVCLASSVKQRHGWPWLKHPSQHPAMPLSSVQRASNERKSEELGESGRQECRGKRGPVLLIYGEAVFPFSLIHINAVCVVHATVTIASEEYLQISHFSQMHSQKLLYLTDHWGIYCTCEPKVYTRRHKEDRSRGAFLDQVQNPLNWCKHTCQRNQRIQDYRK